MSQWVCWLGASPVTWGEVGHRRSGSVQCVCSGKGRRGWRGPGVGQGPRRPGPRARGAWATGRRRGGGRVSLGPAGGAPGASLCGSPQRPIPRRCRPAHAHCAAARRFSRLRTEVLLPKVLLCFSVYRSCLVPVKCSSVTLSDDS